MEAYATVEEYRLDTGDATSPDDRVASALSQQSAKLRSRAGIPRSRSLTEDQLQLARMLVTDAVGKALKPAVLDGLGDVAGAKQASFSANGFQGSYTLANPAGTAYFDRDTLKAFLRSLGQSLGHAVLRRPPVIGEAVAVLHRAMAGEDAMGEPVWEWSHTLVDGALVRPLFGEEVAGALRPDGVRALYSIALPKSYDGPPLAGARIALVGRGMEADDAAGALRVSGAPDRTVPCPTRWDIVFEAGRVDG